ncbi:hypothetical protein Goari_004873 [Gossypium aridum]|uniref:Uncharacterized protein n=1 Tax=Gossypium aridum TaxID=34290 RepID=A0A7J8Y4S5_GOSAI|nr:hypothetical protein [Gossypium aridum]
MLHALRDCPKSRDVLIEANFDNRLLINQYEFCIDWIEDSKHILDKKKPSKTSFLLCGTFGTTKTMLSLEARARTSCKWEKPLEGVTKVNVDASANAFGIITKDSDGFVLSSKAVIFETDYASIVNHFRKHKEDIIILGHRIKEAYKMLDSLSKDDVNLVDRGCNKSVDSLCTWSLSNYCNLSFEMDYPSDIHNITRTSVVNWLRKKLKDSMDSFNGLREKV